MGMYKLFLWTEMEPSVVQDIFGLDLSKCIVTGDVGDTDMLAAHAVGATKIMVRTGWGESSLTKFRDKWAETKPDYIAEDIWDAVQWIIHGKEFRE
ncbi:HAD hydrolase-like protein [Paenibacillus amylolyticus]|nr:HAD hydrolase-like protein [Paenibacillus amylolyticus]WFR62339.1 HAD hydrolase-like protein [Paenibacillus amylolyticus]